MSPIETSKELSMENKSEQTETKKGPNSRIHTGTPKETRA
jgi:hypothetical protein